MCQLQLYPLGSPDLLDLVVVCQLANLIGQLLAQQRATVIKVMQLQSIEIQIMVAIDKLKFLLAQAQRQSLVTE